MHIERHVFGSISGYGTLARSPGLTDGEQQQLESLSFGTPYEPSYQASLSKQVACWSRPLGSGRRAISRVLPGRLDDAGRSTLLFVTAVVSAADWDLELQGDLRALLARAELWEWDGAPELAALDLEGLAPGPLRLSRDGAQRALGLVSLVELSWAARQPVLVRAEHYSLDEVAAVERLLPTEVRREYSAVYRGLNPDLSASLNCLAEGVPAGTSNPVRRLDAAKSPYALRLAGEGLADGRTPEVLLVGYDNFGQPQIDTSRTHTEDYAVDAYAEHGPIGDRRSGAVQLSPALLAALLLLVVLIGGAAGWTVHAASRRPAALATVAPPWEELLPQAIDLPTQTRDEQLTTITGLQTSLGEPPFAGVPHADELAHSLSELRQTIQLTRDAERAIAKVDSDKRSSISAAGRALDALAERAPHAADMLRDWFEARQRPGEDTLGVVSERLRDRARSQLEAMESQADRIDQRTLERARQLRASLNLFESVSTDRPRRWIADHLSRLDGLIRDWDQRLAALDRQQQKHTQQEESRAAENRERLVSRLGALSDALAGSGATAKDRQAVGKALQEVAREGDQAAMGKVFSDPLSRLAAWVLALRDVSPVEHVKAIRVATENCRATARAIERAGKRLSRDNTNEENDRVMADVRTEARTLALQFSYLEGLVKELEVEPQSPSDNSP